MATTFKANGFYTHNYIGDSSLFVTYKVIRRTAKTIWVAKVNRHNGKVSDDVRSYRVKRSRDNSEYVSLGSYSTAPVLRSEDVTESAVLNTKKTVIIADMANRTLNIPGEGEFTFAELGILQPRVNRATILNNVMPLVEKNSTRIEWINENYTGLAVVR